MFTTAMKMNTVLSMDRTDKTVVLWSYETVSYHRRLPRRRRRRYLGEILVVTVTTTPIITTQRCSEKMGLGRFLLLLVLVLVVNIIIHHHPNDGSCERQILRIRWHVGLFPWWRFTLWVPFCIWKEEFILRFLPIFGIRGRVGTSYHHHHHHWLVTK